MKFKPVKKKKKIKKNNYIKIMKYKARILIPLCLLSILIIGCSTKAHLVFSPKEYKYQTGKGKVVAITVLDNRFNKEFCRNKEAACISLDRSPVTHISEAIERGLSSLGFSVNQRSDTIMEIEINDFYISWPFGFNVTLRSEVNLSVSIKNSNKFTLRRKRINSNLTDTASGGGFPAWPVAKNLIQNTFNSTIHKILDDQEIIKSLLENELPATPTPTITQTPAKATSLKIEGPKIEVIKKDKSEIEQAVVLPIGVLGEISENKKTIIHNKFMDVISNDFDLISQEEYERAEEEAFQELDYEECTEDQCIKMIQEILQVENMYKIQLVKDEGDIQVILTYIDLDKKLVKTDFCEDCKTSDLIKMINKLYLDLRKKR